MALNKKVIQSVLASGIDSSADPKLTSQGLLQLTNGRVNYRGAIEKRYGLTTLSGSYTDDQMGKYKGRPVLMGDNLALFNGSTATVGSFDTVDSVLGFDCDITGRYGNGLYKTEGGDSAVVGNVYAVVVKRTNLTDDSAVVGIETYSTVTGELIESSLNLSAASVVNSIRLLKVGSTLYAFVERANRVEYLTIGTDGDIPAATTELPGSNTSDTGDKGISCCVATDDNSTIAILHNINSTESLELIMWELPSTINKETIATMTTLGGFGCFKLDDDKVICSYVDDNAREVYSTGYDSAVEIVVTEDTIYTWADSSKTVPCVVGVANSATVGQIYWTVYESDAEDGEHSYIVRKNTFTDASGTGTAGTHAAFHVGCKISSEPFLDSDSNHYLILNYDYASPTDSHISFLIVDSNGKIRGTILPEYAWHESDTAKTAYANGTDTWLFSADKKVGMQDATNPLTVLTTAEITLSIPSILSVETTSHLHIPNTCPYEYDGNSVYEAGFAISPGKMFGDVNTSASSTDIGVGVYGYMCVYEWTDVHGKRHQSAPSEVESVTTADAKDVVTIQVRPLSLTNRDADEVLIVVYRTLVDGNAYHRLTEIENDSDAWLIEVDDEAGDSSISSNEYVYVTGGVLEHRSPPPYWVSCIHQNRLFVVNNENNRVNIRYSNSFHPTQNVSFGSSFLEVNCSDDGGEIKALASFMDRLLIFKENKIYATHGEGLSPVGTGAGYAVPYLISESIGCTNQKTIVNTPDGLMFESNDGIQLLNKTLQVAPIGDAIKYHYGLVTLVRADIIPDQHSVVFLSDGAALVYDYKYKIWSTNTNHEASDGIVVDNTLYVRDTSTSVLAVKSGIFRDSGSTFSLVIRTGWFPFAQLGGFMRLYQVLLVGQNVSIHKLRIKTAYDFDPVWVDNQTFTSSDLANYLDNTSHFGTAKASSYRDKSYLLEVATSEQKCTAVMLEISDETTGGSDPDAAYSMSGISFLVGLKPFMKRFGTTRKVGS